MPGSRDKKSQPRLALISFRGTYSHPVPVSDVAHNHFFSERERHLEIELNSVGLDIVPHEVCDFFFHSPKF